MSAALRRWGLNFILLAAAVLPASSQQLPGPAAIGRNLFAAGDYAAAEESFTRQLQITPNQPALLFNRATARFNQQKYAAARHDLDRCLQIQPRSAPALAFRAHLHLLLGDALAANTDADAALDLAPRDLDTVLLRARARLALRRLDAALADFDLVLQQLPGQVGALIGRGDLRMVRGDLSAALADFSLAVQHAPADPDARFKLALAQFRAMDFAAAGRSAEAASRLAPGRAPIERLTGMVRYATGDFEAAAHSLRLAIAADGDGASYARFLLRLCERRLDQPLTAIPEPPPDTPHRPWTQMLRGFLLGECSEDELFLGAQNLVPTEARTGRFCEAGFYLGVVRLIEGDEPAARYALQQAVDTNLPDFSEHTLARIELARLKPATAPAPRPRRR